MSNVSPDSTYVRTYESPVGSQEQEILRARAVEMMQVRGLNRVEELLSFAEPARIIAACRWWDGKARKGGITSGLLAYTIREGGMAPQRIAPDPGTQPCPCTDELASAWAAVAVELRCAVETSTFEIWLAPLHPHDYTEGWVLGAPVSTAAWTARRFAHVLKRLCGELVSVVPCAEGTRPGDGPC